VKLTTFDQLPAGTSFILPDRKTKASPDEFEVFMKIWTAVQITPGGAFYNAVSAKDGLTYFVYSTETVIPIENRGLVRLISRDPLTTWEYVEPDPASMLARNDSVTQKFYPAIPDVKRGGSSKI
jgi:hypothetical protein